MTNLVLKNDPIPSTTPAKPPFPDDLMLSPMVTMFVKKFLIVSRSNFGSLIFPKNSFSFSNAPVTASTANINILLFATDPTIPAKKL